MILSDWVHIGSIGMNDEELFNLLEDPRFLVEVYAASSAYVMRKALTVLLQKNLRAGTLRRYPRASIPDKRRTWTTHSNGGTTNPRSSCCACVGIYGMRSAIAI